MIIVIQKFPYFHLFAFILSLAVKSRSRYAFINCLTMLYELQRLFKFKNIEGYNECVGTTVTHVTYLKPMPETDI
jgi:hypothetical protein